MKADRLFAGIGHRIGQQKNLDLRLAEAAAMDILKQRRQAIDEDGRRRHDAGNIRNEAKTVFQAAQGGLGGFRGRVEGVEGKSRSWSNLFKALRGQDRPTFDGDCL